MRHYQHISKYFKFILLNSAVIASGVTSSYAGAAVAPIPAPAAPASTVQSSSNDFKILQDQFAALNAKLEKLEKAQKHASKEAAEVAVAAAKEEVAITQSKSPKQSRTPSEGYKWSSGNTDINIGGQVKVSAIYDAGPPTGDSTNMPALPIKGVDTSTSKSGNYRMHAKASRLNMGTLTCTSKGDVKTFFEIDFYGTNNFSKTGDRGSSFNYTPRLRHAYGEFQGWLAGQTLSNFSDADSIPTTVEDTGPTGQSAFRQAQIRYTKEFNKNWRMAVAVENSITDYTDAYNLTRYDSNTFGQNTNGSGTQPLPDFTFNTRYKSDRGDFITFRALVRRLVTKGLAGDTENNPASVAYSGKATAYGFGVSGKFYTIGKDAIYAQLNAGDGIGRYIYDAYGMSAAYSSRAWQFKKQRAYGAVVGYEHFWADNLRSNVVVGQTRIRVDRIIPIAVPPAAALSRVTSKMQQAFVNLLYKPVPTVEVGIEYGHFKRSTINDQNGTGDRVQVGVTYKW